MVPYHPHSQHIQWLQKIDYRTTIGKRFKKITRLTSKQCKIFLKQKSTWTPNFLESVNIYNDMNKYSIQ